MDTRQFRPLRESTILNVLYHIRSEIVREGLPNLEHVDALLKARGADPEDRLIRRLRPRRFLPNKLREAVLQSLEDGPKTTAQIANHISDHPRTLQSCVHALQKLKSKGLVVIEVPGRGQQKQVWRLP